MTLHQLIILRTVIEEGSFVRAAEVLRVSQPAISAQVKALENELGHVLLRRKPSMGIVEPTEAGRIAYRAALRVLEGLEDLTRELRYLDDNQMPSCREVQVICDVPTGVYILPRLASEFRGRFANVMVKVAVNTDYRAITAKLRQDLYDLAIVPQEVNTPAAVQEFAFIEDLAIVANPALAGSPQASDWASLPLVLPPANSIVRRSVEAYFKRLKIKPNIVLELNHPEAAKKAVGSGPVACITHKVSVQEDLDAGKLVELVPPRPLPRLSYKVVRTRSRLGEHVRAFTSFLQEHLKDRA
ncbi:MAG: LysR family transcriptional regulator [Clostridia bacterium]|jgi:DNA-binding transcriptional LysR family regulator|nr:LysR family transcriptional regulator [Clostridia bacterium]MDH7573707.1 LysR family transcriptional regulator [Clostridia bacterium]